MKPVQTPAVAALSKEEKSLQQDILDLKRFVTGKNGKT
jgi:hypothetical protein